MKAAREAADPDERLDVYRNQMKQLADLRQLYKETAMASGDWHVQTVKTVSSSQRLTEAIQKQKIGMAAAAREYMNYRKTQSGALAEAIKEQAALRGAMAAQMTSEVFGKNQTDLIIPRRLGPELDNIKLRYGMINQMIGAAAASTIDWGKNTQWAGRQITVGMTMPLGMAAVGAAALAKTVDQELTRIAKVYDTTAQEGMAKERELAQLREVSLEGATRMAETYGQKLQEILSVQADLAATGLRGNELIQVTEETVRIGTLGEMDLNESKDMMVSLTTAFKDQLDTTEEVTRALNFFNATENATSLSIKDIAEAIPRAASAMAQLGVSTDEMTVMLVAMREAGVEATEAANALKSGTASILDPSKETVEWFMKTVGTDLSAIVDQAGGNMFKFMQLIGEATASLDPQTIQTVVAKIFGKYQFNRLTALVANFGDAMTEGGNQTAKAMELMGMSTGELAETAAEELERLQQSISHRFTAAVEGLKAALVPLGMATLQIITPIIEGAKEMINWFTDLNPIIKNTVLILLGIGAVVGPLLMLIGIFANLMGNVIKFGAHLGNLFIRFKAVNAEEAAAAIMAKNAASAFDTQTMAAARLTEQVATLNSMLRQNAVAQGLIPDATGGFTAGGNRRELTQDKNGNYRYAAGSQDDQGNKIGGRMADPADVARFREMQDAAADIDSKATSTRASWENIGNVVGMVAGVGITAFATMAGTSDSINDTWINIAMIAGSAFMMFPDLLGGLFRGFGRLRGEVGKIGPTLKGALAGPAIMNALNVMKMAFAVDGVRGMVSAVSLIAPKFTAIAGTALRIFGPIGILAGGAIIVSRIVDDMNKMEEAQQALAGSGKAWADAIGYTFNPGQLPGMEEGAGNKMARIDKIVNDMSKSNAELADAFAAAGDEAEAAGGKIDDWGEVYGMAMQQALRAVSSGATPAQAREVLEASLKMANADPYTIEKLKVRFGEIDLENPEEVRQAIRDAIAAKPVFDTSNVGEVLPTEVSTDSFWDSVLAHVREEFGGDLSSEMRAAGTRAGAELYDGLIAAGGDAQMKNDIMTNLEEQVNGQFDSWIQNIREDSDDMAQAMDELGIKTADQLAAAISRIRKKSEDGKKLTNFEETILEEADDFGSATGQFSQAYEELLDVLAQGWGQSQGWDEDQIARFRRELESLGGLRFDQGIKSSFISMEDAQKGWEAALQESIDHGEKWDEATKLQVLNGWRAAAGMEAASSSAQGFGNAAAGAAGGVEDLADATADLANAANVTADDLANAQKSAYGNTMNDIYEEADRLLQEQQDAQIDAIQARGDAAQKALDEEGDAMDKHYDNLEKANDKHWDTVTKNQEKAHDRQSEDAEAYWDGQEKAIENASEASDKWFEDRKEQLDDEQKAYERATDARIDQLEAEKKAMEEAADARIDSIREQQEAWDEETETRVKGLRDEIEAEQEAEDARQEIFEAEQRRIDRMAERLNNNIDFNVALNSGDLDEAAKIANDVSAREANWSVEDRQREMSAESENRIKSLEEKIEEIETENEARQKAADDEIERIEKDTEARGLAFDRRIEILEAEKEARSLAHEEEMERLDEEQERRRQVFEAQMEQTRLAREEALKALRERQEAEREALAEQRQLDQERLRSARETARQDLENRKESNRQATQNAVENAQAQFEADRRSLAMRLRELQAFTPRNEAELRAHIGRVQEAYRLYGIDLQARGSQWSNFIGNALKTNVDTAAAALQNEINWRMIAQNIASQIGEGMGMSFQQVKTFLQTGQLPAGAPTAPAYRPSRSNIPLFGPVFDALPRHTGGSVGFTGGQPGFSQRERMGVPRSASPYPSEVPTLLKAGEFVVNKSATQANLPLLKAINNGEGARHPAPHHMGGFVAARHMGGLMENVMGNVAMNMVATAMTMGVAAREKINQAQQEAAMLAMMGSSGQLEAGNAPWQRLWNTIKRNFPEAKLNSSVRPGDPGYHGRGMAVDLGWNKAPGGVGNPYMASMNRWIYDNFRGSTELIYNGLGDDRPNLKNGANFPYNAATQSQHRNHVHWAMTPQAIAAAGAKISSGVVGAPASGSVQQQVLAEANRWGFGNGANWNAINWVINKESGWRPTAQNPVSTASGLFQHIDGTWRAYRSGSAARYAKMRLAPVNEQAFAGMNYFKGRYGSPVGAQQFWQRNGWYDDGGYLQPGATGVFNGTGRPEPVFTAEQWDVLKANIGAASYDLPGRPGSALPVRVVDANVASGSQNVYDIDIDLRGAYIKEELDIQTAVEKAIDAREARNGRRRVIGSGR